MDAEQLIHAMERLHQDGFGDIDERIYSEDRQGQQEYTTDFAMVLEQFPHLVNGLKYTLWQGHNGGRLFGLTSGQIADTRSEVYNAFREDSPAISGSRT